MNNTAFLAKFKVLHFPQIPCKAFEVNVETLDEALRISNMLADYDLFQFENKIKPDYANQTLIEWNHPEHTGFDDWEQFDPFDPDEVEYVQDLLKD